MAVTFNGPLKVSRPGYTFDGATVDATGNASLSRQAWQAAVPVVIATTFAGPTPAGTSLGVIPAGSQIVDISAIGFNNLGSALGTGTITVSLGANVIANILVTAVATGTGFDFIGAPSSVAAVGTWFNTGTSDQLLTLGNQGLQSTVPFTVYVTYIPRNTDGSLADEGARAADGYVR